MRIGYILAGFVFLFNPNINIGDVLPDFIGYALVVYGLSKLYDLAPAFAQAQRHFVKLMFLEAAKFALNFLVLGLKDQGYLLVFVFCFTLAEVGFMLAAFSQLFNGFFFVCTMYNGSETVSRLNTAKLASYTFIIGKGVLTLAPEFVYLYVTEDFGYVLASYKTVLNVLCAILVLMGGVAWIFTMRWFLKSAQRDTRFISNMETYYKEYIVPDTNRFLLRRIKLSMTLLGIATIFIFDFYFDGINYLPDFIGAALVLAALIISQKYSIAIRSGTVICAGYFLMGILNWYLGKSYAEKYFYHSIERSPEAFRAYLVTVAVTAAEAAVLFGLLYYLYRYFLDMVKNHTGRPIESVFKSMIDRDKRQRRGMQVKCMLFLTLGIVAAISAVVQTACLYVLPIYWLANLVVFLAWSLITFKLTSDIVEQAEGKYL